MRVAPVAAPFGDQQVERGQILAREGIGLPVTAFAHGPRKAEDVIKEVGGVPIVIKLVEGTQGVGVILAETEGSAKSIIEAFSVAKSLLGSLPG